MRFAPDPKKPLALPISSMRGVFLGAFSTFVLAGAITLAAQWIVFTPPAPASVMVIVANRDLQPGVPIEPGDLYAVQMPVSLLPDNVFLRPKHVVGRVAHERILAHELLRADRLSQPYHGIGLNMAIPDGMRAVSLNVSEHQALAGYISPTSLVDVLVTHHATSRSPRRWVDSVLEGVFVLEVRPSVDSRQVATVTVLVNPEQAESLAQAEALGVMSVVLRGG